MLMRPLFPGACLSAVVLLALGGAGRAADWPQFMGPNADGTVKDAGVARTWPADGPRELWKVSVGPGFGGAAIAKGKVYFLDRVNDKHDVLRVFDLATGQEEWSYAYDAAAKTGGYPGNRSTPTVDGDYVYTVGVLGHLHCISLKDRKPVWKKSLMGDLGAKAGQWHVAQSALVVGDKLIVSLQSAAGGLAALHKLTGEVLWKSEVLGAADTYTTPQLISLGGARQVLAFHKGCVAGLDPADGKVLWRYEGYSVARPIPQAVPIGDGRIFLTSGYGKGCAMIRLDQTDGSWKVTELFNDQRSASRVPPAVLHEGHIYTNSESFGLQCLTADGQVKWQTAGKPGFDMGSLIVADGLIFLVHGAAGTLHLIEASPAGFKQLASAKVLSGKQIWGPLALADGKLVLRDQSQLKCLDVAAR